MKKILNRLFEYGSLSEQEAKATLTKLAQGEFNPSQIAAFLTVYSMRSITVEELTGFRDAMLELCLRIDLDDFDAMDLCGTGGDGQDTFNISTLSSFIVAGAGQNVAKHGNNGVSSVCGSSNLMAHFGYDFTNDVDTLRRNLDEAGICFIHAPLFHPAMKNVAPIRRELGVKTFFNMLGPMVNPSFPKKQIVGVFSLEIARLYGYLYQQTEKQFAILHSLDVYDEISLTSPFKIITKESERLLKPEDLGLHYQTKESLFGGGTIAESAKIFTDVLENKGTVPQQEAVLANAGVAIATGKGLAFEEGVAQARESLESGAALNAFKKLINS
ncbi:anthranilate phosphoribosyltransferase [Flammeovirga kamogawensis]|uniref:Anthranilate phosphoribosyltransferase n=1 Tax=Flammeovirga kamogawensis TaxID=373891 RepID=A0ABX8GRI7_9BACT|nr:anthranilate phosphoribosyltransferase [Flammeovirga kamogawensis]MBB6462148.1 anthranilate phosphoribosyltransferase [Flammeovirga kamogawensis]QWG05882.1 anthranilate phosphoribosyltransferase [Flammeovirga kamogawensis]TRX67706.1 anthranilate phosphoribosyltransferase [Flammeovirga kamogawensis]